MATVTIHHQPDREKPDEIQSYPVEWDSITLGEVMDLEKLSGQNFLDFKMAFLRGSVTAMVLMVYVIRRRTEEGLTLAKVRSEDYAAFGVTIDAPADDEDDEESPSGKAPSDESEQPTP